jgi:hypothetical protein
VLHATVLVSNAEALTGDRLANRIVKSSGLREGAYRCLVAGPPRALDFDMQFPCYLNE